MNTICIGIDPGVTGAIAILAPDGKLWIHDMPTVLLQLTTKTPKGEPKTRREIVLAALADIFEPFSPRLLSVPVHAVVEKVGASPQMGVNSAFTFGQAFCAPRMALAAYRIPTTEATPQEWMGYVMPATKGSQNKSRNILHASELFPDHAARFIGHDGRADAAMIAWYCQQHVAFKNIKAPVAVTKASMLSEDDDD